MPRPSSCHINNFQIHFILSLCCYIYYVDFIISQLDYYKPSKSCSIKFLYSSRMIFLKCQFCVLLITIQHPLKILDMKHSRQCSKSPRLCLQPRHIVIFSYKLLLTGDIMLGTSWSQNIPEDSHYKEI